ncbi:MAG: DUF4392 domain-containing protein [Planctomycetes bacterium]|nr:DUF4392 domain-containing protein [Planctomycetota bacterium]MBI3834165.1 DUF4392 domain-containing protein [Planctomycetota bacterium]
MNPRITSIENLIASDPGGRNVFELAIADQLRLAAQSLRLARRVGIVSGFFIADAGAGETDGPPGAKVLGDALAQLGIPVDYITDSRNAPLFAAVDREVLVEPTDYLTRAQPTHLVSIERPGRGRDGRYRNMKGADITAFTAPLDELFIEASRIGLTTIGIGDGGNEIGMGNVFAETLAAIPLGKQIASIVATDFCILAGVSNWGAYGLAGALSVLAGRDLLPTPQQCAQDFDRMVRVGGAVDGVSHRRECSVDGLPLSASLRMLENIRRQIAPSPLSRGVPIRIGVLGYGEAGRAAAQLLSRQGHRVRISDHGPVMLESGLTVDGVETGGHTIEFLGGCDLIVASPGVREDAPIRDELHQRGVPVMSELEMASQLCPYAMIAVTGTIGKRTTVELMQRLFRRAGRELTIGGNRGRPLSALLLDEKVSDPLALAVSSFQLESVVHFRPHIAVMLNINDAHLDRHRSVAEYIRTKSRIFMNHRPDDILILPYDDERLRPLARKHRGQTLFISARQPVDRGAWIEGNHIFVRIDEETKTIPTFQISAEFSENILSVAIVGQICEIAGNHR